MISEAFHARRWSEGLRNETEQSWSVSRQQWLLRLPRHDHSGWPTPQGQSHGILASSDSRELSNLLTRHLHSTPFLELFIRSAKMPFLFLSKDTSVNSSQERVSRLFQIVGLDELRWSESPDWRMMDNKRKNRTTYRKNSYTNQRVLCSKTLCKNHQSRPLKVVLKEYN